MRPRTACLPVRDRAVLLTDCPATLILLCAEAPIVEREHVTHYHHLARALDLWTAIQDEETSERTSSFLTPPNTSTPK
jgi:hypothetical protein